MTKEGSFVEEYPRKAILVSHIKGVEFFLNFKSRTIYREIRHVDSPEIRVRFKPVECSVTDALLFVKPKIMVVDPFESECRDPLKGALVSVRIDHVKALPGIPVEDLAHQGTPFQKTEGLSWARVMDREIEGIFLVRGSVIDIALTRIPSMAPENSLVLECPMGVYTTRR